MVAYQNKKERLGDGLEDATALGGLHICELSFLPELYVQNILKLEILARIFYGVFNS